MNNKVKRIKTTLEAAGHTNVQVEWESGQWMFHSNQSDFWTLLGSNVNAALREIKINHQIKRRRRKGGIPPC